jgi:acetyl esterase/lipase
MNWASLSQQERDAAYNNAASVPNSAALVRERNEASATLRAANAKALDLPYAAGARTKWDFYPAANPAAPCFIFIHGGYWQMNRREDFAIFAAPFLVKGWSAALPGYSLAPEASLTRIVAELRTALDWFAAHAKSHFIAPEKIVLAGWSAGAHLAALLLDHPIIAAGLAISGVYELAPIRDTYLNEKLRLTDAEITELSPLRLPEIPKPLVIAYGSRELPALVNDSRALHEKRARAHFAGALLPIAGADHFTVLHDLQDAYGELVHAAEGLVLSQPTSKNPI